VNRRLQYMLIYLVFGFYWTSEFIIAASMVTVASVAYQVCSFETLKRTLK
jgi:proline dehydrogenase